MIQNILNSTHIHTPSSELDIASKIGWEFVCVWKVDITTERRQCTVADVSSTYLCTHVGIVGGSRDCGCASMRWWPVLHAQVACFAVAAEGVLGYVNMPFSVLTQAADEPQHYRPHLKLRNILAVVIPLTNPDEDQRCPHRGEHNNRKHAAAPSQRGSLRQPQWRAGKDGEQ